MSALTSPITRRCMRDHIRDTLLKRILEGAYPSGERLIELNLAHEFQVSQTPIREALRELEAMGMVTSERYCGTHVRSINTEEIAESYALRAILEERAAQLATPCPDELLADLRQTIDNMRTSATARDIASYTQQAAHFHRRIVEQSGNRLFLQTWDNLQTISRIHFMAQWLIDCLPQYVDAHETIYHALKDKDGHTAGQLLRRMFEQLIAELKTAEDPSLKNS